MAPRRDGLDTRRTILAAAALAFGRKGFHETTIAEICQAAGTNIASVNYHFGHKEALYVECWREAFRRSHAKHPPGDGLPPGAPPEERLRGWIRAMLRCIADPESHDLAIMHREWVNPTGLLAEAIPQMVAPVQAILTQIIEEILGDGASRTDVFLCEMSIQSQCMNPVVFQQRHPVPDDAPAPPMPKEVALNIEAIAEHAIAFSLGGLAQARRQIEARRAQARKPKRRKAACI